MSKTRKKRLNLYIRDDIISFAREWSYVTEKPISKIFEEYLENQQKMVATTTPFQWLNDPVINPSLPPEDRHFLELEEYLNNKEEEEFCRKNPDHPRAKMRRKLAKEHEQYLQGKMARQRENEQNLIQRWMEVFQSE